MIGLIRFAGFFDVEDLKLINQALIQNQEESFHEETVSFLLFWPYLFCLFI
jgi:hypothetical protein